MGKPTRSTKKRAFRLSLSTFVGFEIGSVYMKIPELRWCLAEITFNNPSQFPGMF